MEADGRVGVKSCKVDVPSPVQSAFVSLENSLGVDCTMCAVIIEGDGTSFFSGFLISSQPDRPDKMTEMGKFLSRCF